MDNFLVFLAAFSFLFLLPGLAATWLLFPSEELDVFERAALSPILSCALLLGIFVLTNAAGQGWGMVRYGWLLLAGVVTVVGASSWWHRSRPARPPDSTPERPDVWPVLVFLLILVVSSLLTLYTIRDEDDWTYFQIVRAMADANRYSPTTPETVRFGWNIWWLFHAFAVQTFDFDIVRLGRDYLPLVLVPLSFLAFYLLAKALFRNKRLAILTSVLQLVFLILDFFYYNHDFQLSGAWVLGRIDQDHTAVQFIFLPVYAASIVHLLRSGKIRWLASSVIALVVVVAVHPQGLLYAALITGPFLLVDLLLTWRRENVKRTIALSAPFVVLGLILLPFIFYWQAFTQARGGYDVTSLINGQSIFPYLLGNTLFFSPSQFILWPAPLAFPIPLATLLLTPGLAFFLRKDLAARYLFSLVMSLLLTIYNPIAFVFLFRWLGWSEYRLWYLFPWALVIGFMTPHCWALVRKGISKLRHRIFDRQALGAMLLMAAVVVVLSRVPAFIRTTPVELGVTHSLPEGTKELMDRLRQQVQASSIGGVVLAPAQVSDPIPAYHPALVPLLFRTLPDMNSLYDAQTFYSDALLTTTDVQILDKHDISYLILPTTSEQTCQFDLRPRTFELLFRSSQWTLYRVKRPIESDLLIQANTSFIYGDWQTAIDRYNAVLDGSAPADARDGRRSLAHAGLGMLLELSGLTRKAVAEFEQAVQIEPQNAQAHFHLVGLYRKLGMEQEAAVHARAAGPLMREAANPPSER